MVIVVPGKILLLPGSMTARSFTVTWRTTPWGSIINVPRRLAHKCASAVRPNAVHIYTADATDLAGNVVHSGNEAILGSSKADNLGGTSGNDIVIGNGGNDRILGGGSADVLMRQRQGHLRL